MALAVLLATSAPAAAQEGPGAAAPDWERAVYKALTYQAVTSVSGVLLFGAVVGGTPAVGTAFVAVGTLSGVALYYSYELAWDAFGPPADQMTHGAIAAKTAAYRALAVTGGFGIGYAFAGEAATAAGLTLAQAIADTTIYVANEYGWDAYWPRL